MNDPDLKNFEEELAEFLEANRRPAPVYSGRVCRWCGGCTVECVPLRRVVGYRHGTSADPIEGTPIAHERRRFYCDPCDRVTS